MLRSVVVSPMKASQTPGCGLPVSGRPLQASVRTVTRLRAGRIPRASSCVSRACIGALARPVRKAGRSSRDRYLVLAWTVRKAGRSSRDRYLVLAWTVRKAGRSRRDRYLVLAWTVRKAGRSRRGRCLVLAWTVRKAGCSRCGRCLVLRPVTV
jgi:hypothetical protein